MKQMQQLSREDDWDQVQRELNQDILQELPYIFQNHTAQLCEKTLEYYNCGRNQPTSAETNTRYH